MNPGTWFWAGVLVVAVWITDWGADRLTGPLRTLRRRRGLSPVAGSAVIGLALASPEITINATSALRNVSDIGLGLVLGGNVLSLPLLTSIAYVASRRRGLEHEADGGEADHERHLDERLLRVRSDAVTSLVLPYVGIILLMGALTVPRRWRGLQPVDGWIMLAAYLVFLFATVAGDRGSGEDVEWSRRESGLAAAGVLVLIAGAYGIVVSTERLVTAFGISGLLGGLFITAPIGMAPEAFGTWHVTRSGQVTAGASDVITDSAVTLTLGLFPLAMVTVPINEFRLYWVSLGSVLAMTAVYGGLIRLGSDEPGFELWQVLLFDALYLVYLAVLLVWVLNLF